MAGGALGSGAQAASRLSRKVYRSLLKKAAVLDSLDVTQHMKHSPMVRHMLRPDLAEAVYYADLTNVTAAVRKLAREERFGKPEIGLEALKIMAVVADVGQAPRTVCEVGDVVRHRVCGDVGVIVTVHEAVKMPEEWVMQNVGSMDHPFLNEAWYDVLLDVSHGGFVRHGAQRNHERISAQVNHPALVQAGWVYCPKTGRYTKPVGAED
eukprot:Rhum_TRINITY_DN16880_c0_g1::Rhum_TRINITY_DN16880_c0_g1_i1::g.164689::m.164689